MLKVINRFNKWFDSLEEPRRFLLFISYMSVAIFSLELGLKYENKISSFIGLTLFSIASIVAADRAFNLSKIQKFSEYASVFFRIMLFISLCMLIVFVISLYISILSM